MLLCPFISRLKMVLVCLIGWTAWITFLCSYLLMLLPWYLRTSELYAQVIFISLIFFGKLIQIHLFVSVTCKWLFVIATIVRYLNASSHVYILCHLGHYEIWNVIVNQVIWFIDLDFVIVNASIKNTEAFVKKYFKLFNCTIIVVNSQNYLLILNY